MSVMKNIYSILKVAVVSGIALLLSSCAKHDEIKYVPSDSFVVMKVAQNALFDKSGFVGNDRIKNLIDDDEDEAALLKEFVDNPENAGIDTGKPLVLAVNEDGVCLVEPVKDAKAVNEFLTRFGADSDVSADVSKGVLYEYDLGSGSAGLLTKDALIFAFGEFDPDKVKQLLTDEGRIDAPGYKEFLSSASDLAAWADYTKLIKKFDTENEIPFNLGSSSVISESDFLAGEVRSNMKLYWDKFDFSVFKKGSDKFFKYIPEDAFIVGKCDFGSVKNLIDALPSSISSLINSLLVMAQFDSSILKKTGGNITVAYIPENNGFVLAFDCSKELVDEYAPELDFEEVDDNVYALGDELLAVYENGGLVLLSPEIYDAARSGSFASFKGNRLAGKFGAGIAVDFRNAFILDLLKSESGIDLGIFDYAVGELKGASSTGSLFFTDTRENSAKQLLDFFLDIVEKGDIL